MNLADQAEVIGECGAQAAHGGLPGPGVRRHATFLAIRLLAGRRRSSQLISSGSRSSLILSPDLGPVLVKSGDGHGGLPARLFHPGDLRSKQDRRAHRRRSATSWA